MKKQNKLLKAATMMFAMAVILVTGSFCKTVEAASANEIEATGTNLGLNNAIVSKLDTCKSENWYYFDITQPGYFNVSLAPTADANWDDIDQGWKLTIYDKTLFGSSCLREYSGWKTQGNTASFAMHTGRYFIKIVASDSYSDSYAPTNVPYTMKVNFTASNVWETEYNDDNKTANVIAPDETYYGTTFWCKDNDWYKVTTTKDGYYQLHFQSEPTNDIEAIDYGWTVEVYDNNLVPIKTYSYVKSSLDTIKMPWKKGTFYIKVMPADTWSDSYAPSECTYSFSLKQVESASWEQEWNDTMEDANSISLNKEYLGITHWCKDCDWYKFTVPEKGAVNIALSKDDANNLDDIDKGWTVELYNKASNAPLQKLDAITVNGNVTVNVGKGTFYIKVMPTDTWSDSYAPTDCIYHLKAAYTKAPATVKMKSISAGKKQATIKWNKVTGAKGYYIYRSTSKKGVYKKIATIKKGSTVTYKDKKGLKSKKRYYYYVSAYASSNGVTVEGAKSKIKNVKVK